MKITLDDELWQTVKKAALQFVGREQFTGSLEYEEPDVPTNLASAIKLCEHIKESHIELRRVKDEDVIFYFLCRHNPDECAYFLYQMRVKGILIDDTNIRKRLREWEKNDGMGYAQPTPSRTISDYVLDPCTQYTHTSRYYLHCLPWEEE